MAENVEYVDRGKQLQDKLDKRAQKLFGRNSNELNHYEQVQLHAGGDTAVSPQNPLGHLGNHPERFTGSVTDPQGNPIPGSYVVAQDEEDDSEEGDE